VLFTLAVVAAHVIPAIAVWTIVGSVLTRMPQPVAVVMAVAYALVHGAAETFDLRLRPPGIEWQVPSTWLRGRGNGARILIWGAILGPGIATRNPYAGMWFVPILLATVDQPSTGALAGALVGLIHGTARAFGVLANQRDQDSPELPWRMMISQMRFRRVDGAALLAAAAALLATA
jgi:hypothetical protein